MFSLPSSYSVLCVPSRRAGRWPSSYRGFRCEGLNCGACAAARAGRRKHPACHPVRWSQSPALVPPYTRRYPARAGTWGVTRGSGLGLMQVPQCGDTPQGSRSAWLPSRGGGSRPQSAPTVGPLCVEMPAGTSRPPESGYAFSPHAVIAHAAANVEPAGYRHGHPASARASPDRCDYSSAATTQISRSSSNVAYLSHTYPSPSSSNSSGTR